MVNEKKKRLVDRNLFELVTIITKQKKQIYIHNNH